MKFENCSAYILAGGLSSRMGTDKGLLILKNKKIIEYVIENLKPCFDQIFIVTSNLEYEQFSIPLLPDLIFGKGPALGIYSALKHSSVNQNFIISCDTPFLDTNVIFRILTLAKNHEICIASNKGFWEPLFGVYNKSIMEEWKRSLDSGEFKLQRLIEKFDYKLLDAETDLLVNSSAFLNINSPDDLLEAEKLMK